jgi:hypothetical protein
VGLVAVEKVRVLMTNWYKSWEISLINLSIFIGIPQNIMVEIRKRSHNSTVFPIIHYLAAK